MVKGVPQNGHTIKSMRLRDATSIRTYFPLVSWTHKQKFPLSIHVSIANRLDGQLMFETRRGRDNMLHLLVLQSPKEGAQSSERPSSSFRLQPFFPFPLPSCHCRHCYLRTTPRPPCVTRKAHLTHCRQILAPSPVPPKREEHASHHHPDRAPPVVPKPRGSFGHRTSSESCSV